MNRIATVGSLLCFLFLSWLPSPSFAQPSGMDRGMGMHRGRGEKRCWKALELDLSSDQRKGLDVISQSFLEESHFLRTELFSKKLEFRQWLTDPAVKAEAIRVKQVEIVELQSRLEATTFEYLLRIRNLLTPEQLKRWCPESELPHFGRMTQSPFMGPLPPPLWHGPPRKQ